MDRTTLLSRVVSLREHMTAPAFRALTEGREPEELSDDTLRYLIRAVERALAREES